MEDTLDGRPSRGKWRVVGIFHEVADELFGSGLQDEQDKVDVWISVNFDLVSSLGHVTWAGAGCCDEGWVAGEKRTMATSRYVVEPL